MIVSVPTRKSSGAGGFSLLELIVVVAITLTIAAIALPATGNMMSLFSLRNASSDFTGIVQQARSRAVQDSRYYSVYMRTASTGTQAFVNIYPWNTDGTSGSTLGATIDPKDPMVAWGSDITVQPQTAAPNAGADLKALFLPTGSAVVPLDGSAAASAITFGPMGTPCVPATATGGSLCNASSGPTAYWTFFQSNRNQQWEAITVTPAGKIQKWSYTGTTWTAL